MRFHKHEDDKIVVHLLVELYARSPEEATEVLEEAARGALTITSLAEESRPPASTGDEPPLARAVCAARYLPAPTAATAALAGSYDSGLPSHSSVIA